MRRTRLERIFSRASVLISFCFFIQCSDEALLETPTTNNLTVESGNTTASITTGCGCTYVVPPKTYTVDGKALGIKPGAVICLTSGATYYNMVFKNIRGTASDPVTIKNCGGTVTLNATGKAFGLKTQLSSSLKITGGTGTSRGIIVNGGYQSMQIEYLTTDIEIDHVEVANSGFAGIMAKTDPSCDPATWRSNFIMRNVIIHDNYIHDTGGEGMYVGNNFYLNGMNTSCGVKLPHVIEGVKIYNNYVKNSGWESIQVASAPKGVEVYNNKIENYGVKNVKYQNHGVQFGEGAPGKFYGNHIKGGKGNAVMILSNAENFIHDNVIINAGGDGIFADERTAFGAGFKLINNTIINPGANGIKLYTEKVTMNTLINNIIINPGMYSSYTYPRTGNDAYVYFLGSTVKRQMLNNYFSRDINSAKFVSPSSYNYVLSSASPLINKGASISTYGITVDHALKPRLRGTAYDIGAYEYQ